MKQIYVKHIWLNYRIIKYFVQRIWYFFQPYILRCTILSLRKKRVRVKIRSFKKEKKKKERPRRWYMYTWIYKFILYIYTSYIYVQRRNIRASAVTCWGFDLVPERAAALAILSIPCPHRFSYITFITNQCWKLLSITLAFHWNLFTLASVCLRMFYRLQLGGNKMLF